MKKINVLLLLLILPIVSYGQMIGFGGQYSDGAKGQFVASMAYPTFHQKN